jgi:hypothetical protein
MTVSEQKRQPRGWLALLSRAMALGLSAAAACSSPPRQPAVPHSMQQRAVVPGMPNVRYRAPDVEALTRDLQVTVQRERALRSAAGHDGPLPPISFLALSGGGADGAFGAGLRVGWTQPATGRSSTSSPASAPAR